VSETEARERRSAVRSREPLTDWHRVVERLNVETCEAADAAFGRGETAGVRKFLWDPLRAFLAAVLRGRLSQAVLGAYWKLARAAKLWEAEMRWRERHLESFEQGRIFGVARREWRDTLERLLDEEGTADRISGGRGVAWRIATDQGTVIVRRFRRGGAMRWLGESYFGFRPRPIVEFRVLLRARRRGLPVPDPIAAVVERRFGLAYRGHLLMREIGDSLPVLDFLGRRPDLDVVPLLAHGLRDLHDAGLWHPDLNLGNVLVVMRSYGASLAYVDLDRARLHDRPLGIAARRRSLRRLRRSAAKLDPAGRLLGAPALGRLEEMYWRLGPTSDAQVEESRGAS
jgi:3-deoxy-D-manno-octulosonic acid kinase